MSDGGPAITPPTPMPEDAERRLKHIAERIEWKAGPQEPGDIGSTISVAQSYEDSRFPHAVASALWSIKHPPAEPLPAPPTHPEAATCR